MIKFLETTKAKNNEELLMEYEVYSSKNEDNEFGSLYKVDVYLEDKGVNEGIMIELKEEVEDLVKISSHHAVLFLSADEGVHEIENALGLLLQAGELGTYKWKCLN